MRRSGILMHITSLPSPYGIGTLGKEAYRFVDFLHKAGQSCWQILPLGQTGYGDSPYQSCSTYAGNPYMVDPDQLVKEGYLTKKEVEAVSWGDDPENVDFAGMYVKRYPLLRKAFERFQENIPADYDAFCWEEGQWLEDYALFMAIKDENGGVSWDKWDKNLRLREPKAMEEAKARLGMEMFFWKMVQYFFFRQWEKVKAYAHEKGITIIGDIPIYVAADSADVWANPWYFALDEEGTPVEVAGCPPDAFSADGQLWGNPVYRWDVLQKDGYGWWIERLRRCLQTYDELRIDHFRGFDSYYCIPYGDKDAKKGYWRQGPGMDFFRAIQYQLGSLPLIAEDLGYLTPSVLQLLAEAGYPGMKVLQFAFGSNETNAYLPHHHVTKAVIYTGTHDNHTIRGWWDSIPRKERQETEERLHRKEGETPEEMMMRAALESVCETCILTMQDVLRLDGSARMNEPSTVGKNWKWRAAKNYLDDPSVWKWLRKWTKYYDRLPSAEPVPAPEMNYVPVGEKLPQPGAEDKPAEKPEENEKN